MKEERQKLILDIISVLDNNQFKWEDGGFLKNKICDLKQPYYPSKS